MRALFRMRARLRGYGRPLAFWLSLGFFVGWLSAPDFMRDAERSVAGSWKIAALEPGDRLDADDLRAYSGGGRLRSPGSVDDDELGAGLVELADDEDAELEDDELDDEDLEDDELDDDDPAPRRSRSNLGPRPGTLPTTPASRLAAAAEAVAPRSFGSAAFGGSDQSGGYDDGYGGAYQGRGGLLPAGYPNSGSSGESAGDGSSTTPPGGFSLSDDDSDGSGDGGSTPPPGGGGGGNGGGGGGGTDPPDRDPAGGGDDEEPTPLELLMERLLDALDVVEGTPVESGKVFVGFSPAATRSDIDAVLSTLDPERREAYYAAIDTYLVTISDASDPLEVVATLAASPLIEIAAPSFFRVPSLSLDPQAWRQWSNHNVGQPAGSALGIADADIDAPEGWTLLSRFGSGQRVTVAVIDTGFDVQHEDLADVIRWTYNSVAGTTISDGALHGTAVAGAVAALGDNARGIAGANKQWVDLWVAKAGRYNQQADADLISDASVVDAILSMRSDTVVANLSFASTDFNPVLCAAIAARPSVLFVAAAGNASSSSDPNRIRAHYPAACGSDNLLSVTASDGADLLWERANRSTTVHVAAPGAGIYTAVAGSNDYAYMSGTSMAAAVASGVASLMALDGPSLSASQLRNRIRHRDRTDQPQGLAPFSRVNLCRALNPAACLYHPMIP